MKSLFVPTDLSNHSIIALDYALQLSKIVKAHKLTFFYHNAQPIDAEIPILYQDDLEAASRELEQKMREVLAKQLEIAGVPDGFLEAEFIVDSAPVGTAYAIGQQAKKAKADLIIMGTHGRTGMDKFLYGSVTSAVLESSAVPVLAIPPRFHFKPVERISFASSLTYFTHEVRTLLDLIGDFMVELEIIHIDYGLISEKNIAHAKRMLEKFNDSRIQLSIVPAEATDSLNENLKAYLQKSKTDWLVMFPAKRDWFDKLFFSSKTLELANSFRKPMLIIQKKEE